MEHLIKHREVIQELSKRPAQTRTDVKNTEQQSKAKEKRGNAQAKLQNKRKKIREQRKERVRKYCKRKQEKVAHICEAEEAALTAGMGESGFSNRTSKKHATDKVKKKLPLSPKKAA